MIDQQGIYQTARAVSLVVISASALFAAVILIWVSYSKAFLAELLNSFRLQLLLLDLLMVSVLSLLTIAIIDAHHLVWFALLINVICAGLLCLPILRFALVKSGPRRISGDSIRVGSFNKQIGNKNSQLLVEQIKMLNLDLVGVSEVKAEDFSALRKINYPYMHSTNSEYGLGKAEFFIMSKYSLSNMKHFQLDRFGNCMRFEVKANGEKLVIFLIHTTAPIAPELYEKRNEGLDQLAKMMNSEKQRKVIAFGDMNVTPYSWAYQKFAKSIAPGIYNVTQGWGLNFTWKYTGPLITQLDHMWASSSIYTSKFTVDKRLKSDHSLIWADLSYKN